MLESSQGFPETVGVFEPPADAVSAAFVAKIDPTGTHLVYSTLLGTIFTQAHTLVVDAAGNAYFSGESSGPGYPTTPNELSSIDYGGFVTKLNPTGDGLVYSVVFSEFAYGQVLAVDSAGCAYVAGQAGGRPFPTTPGAPQASPVDLNDSYVLKIDAAGRSAVYATMIAGHGSDVVTGIDVDASGSACVVGVSESLDLPTTPNALQPAIGTVGNPLFNGDGFVARLDPAGTEFVFLTYLGGSLHDEANGVRFGPSGDIYVCGYTGSPDFPTTPGALDTAPVNPDPELHVTGKPFVARLTADGGSLVFSTLFGVDRASFRSVGLLVDALGNVYFASGTQEPDFRLTEQLYIDNASGVYLAGIDASGSNLLFASQVASLPDDRPYGLVTDPAGNFYVAGGRFDSVEENDYDGFVAKLINLSPSAVQVSDPASGDVFIEETDAESPNYGFWQYRATNGKLFLGRADVVTNRPGVFVASRDKKGGRYKMSAEVDYRAGNATVKLRDLRDGERRRIRNVLP